MSSVLIDNKKHRGYPKETMKPQPSQSFGEIRTLVEDLFLIRPGIYWADFLLTMTVAWSGYLFCVGASLHERPLLACLALLLSALAFYRGLVFVHEMTHVRTQDLTLFKILWNALCGMFIFIPSYTYLCHSAHHRVTSFSTKGDPEYLPLAYQKPFQLLSPFLVFPVLPFLLAFRFLLIGPLSLVIGGRFRHWVLHHASSLKMNLRYEWTTITDAERRLALVQDLLCLAWWGAFIGLCAWGGVLFRALAVWGLLVYLIQCINHFRSLVAHRYVNLTGEKVSYEDQLLDSITITDFSPGAWIFTPIGLRYHSLHHMFPTMPYHAMAAAHARLQSQLPAGHLYFRTLRPTFFSCMKDFFRYRPESR